MMNVKNFPYENNSTNSANNAFVQQAIEDSNITRTGNQALAYKSLDDRIITDFIQSGSVKAVWDVNDAIEDFKQLLDLDPVRATLNAVYSRIITREIKDFEGKKLGKHIGGGLRKLPMIRFYTLAIFYPKLFEIVKWYIPLIGRWKDFIDLLTFDLVENDNDWNKRKLHWDSIYEVISLGLNTDFIDLIKKYLPPIKANSKIINERQAARNAIAKWLAYKMFGDDKTKYAKYRRFKASGKAHEWQKLISRQEFDKIDFDKIPTRALLHFVFSGMANKYVREKFIKWLEETNKIEFKGYPYEILNQANVNKAIDDLVVRTIINKSFQGFIANIVQKQTDVLTVVDISGSMYWGTIDGKIQAIDVAKSLAVLFSYSLQSAFKNMVWTFSDEAEVIIFDQSDDPVTRFYKIDGEWGSTDPMKVIEKMIEFKQKGVPESDFPKTILMLSDGEFNAYFDSEKEVKFKENVYKTLLEAGFSKDYLKQLKIVIWDIRNAYYEEGRKTVFHTDSVEDDLIIYISGFDGAIINFLLGIEQQSKPARTTKEIYQNAMNQPLLVELAQKLQNALQPAENAE